MFRIFRRIAACAMIGFSAIASSQPTFAAQNDRRLMQTPAYAPAHAPGARLAAVVGGGAITRSQGVVAYAHPSVGQYCLKPASNILIAYIVPVVSVDWSTSTGNGLFAFWRSTGNGCAAGYISILTYAFSGGGDPVLSDLVGFTVVVP